MKITTTKPPNVPKGIEASDLVPGILYQVVNRNGMENWRYMQPETLDSHDPYIVTVNLVTGRMQSIPLNNERQLRFDVAPESSITFHFE